MTHRSAVEAPHTDGPIRLGDALVGIADPTMRGVGKSLAAKAIAHWYLGIDWEQEDLTDDDGRKWQYGQLIAGTSAALESVGDILNEIEDPKIHAVAPMNAGFVPELRKLVRGTGLGVSINNPFTSQLMRMVQYKVDNKSTASDSFMYQTFTMGNGPILVTPDPETVIGAAESLGQRAKNIGEIVAKQVIRIRSEGMERRGRILSYDV